MTGTDKAIRWLTAAAVNGVAAVARWFRMNTLMLSSTHGETG